MEWRYQPRNIIYIIDIIDTNSNVKIDADQKSWYFLPRKRSLIPYTEQDDEKQSANVLLIANEDFTKIEMTTIGELDVLYGFTSLKFIPGTDLLIATRVKEFEDQIESYVGVFDKHGNFFSEPRWIKISSSYKYEGIEVK